MHGSADTPTIGQNYSLTCTVSEAGSSSLTYQWKKAGIALVNETRQTLLFASLRLSDAGQYTCEVTVNYTSIGNEVVRCNSFTLRIQSEYYIINIIYYS